MLTLRQAQLVDTTLQFTGHFWAPMGVTIWTIEIGAKYVCESPPTKFFQNIWWNDLAPGICVLMISPSKKG